MDLVSLMSIAVSMIAVTLGGSPKLLLIRESFFTDAFGIACFVSLALPPAAVLVVSPIILGGLLIATIVWTFA